MIAALIPLFGTVLDKIFPDPAAANEAKFKMMALMQSGDIELTKQAGSIITAEANSEHWIVAAWRPITALMLAFIIANNYIIYPYLSLFIDNAPMIDIPPDLWELLKLMIGGYVASRGVEKSIKTWKDK